MKGVGVVKTESRLSTATWSTTDPPPPTPCLGVEDPTAMYVDDTSSVVSAPDQDSLLAAAQMLTTRQAEWLQDNGMVVSPGKSKLMV